MLVVPNRQIAIELLRSSVLRARAFYQHFAPNRAETVWCTTLRIPRIEIPGVHTLRIPRIEIPYKGIRQIDVLI